MSAINNIDDKILGHLHSALSQELLNRIKDREPTPTDLNVARQLLKDNNITVTPAAGNPLLNIAEELPYDSAEGEPAANIINSSAKIREVSG